MACAGLLAVCLLRPPAPRPPRRPEPTPDAGPAGHALFQDVFRRADKNDDGKLSFEEFQNYFADGVLSPGELRELFSGIDGHFTDNLETEKLCDYFSEHLGVYRPVLAALESLNRAVLTAMDATKLAQKRVGGGPWIHNDPTSSKHETLYLALNASDRAAPQPRASAAPVAPPTPVQPDSVEHFVHQPGAILLVHAPGHPAALEGAQRGHHGAACPHGRATPRIGHQVGPQGREAMALALRLQLLFQALREAREKRGASGQHHGVSQPLPQGVGHLLQRLEGQHVQSWLSLAYQAWLEDGFGAEEALAA
ncbi:N-terminal EF-hand calcium-binding protein 3 isoform X4 [Lemur catta]|uniref:N-terminal EF-hand calcium-binding protein 3 isoform X4 n=1 Tax=Lemur catta TaxID=9447 RepID=UPI001E26C561|nr:N-terminal EF-hand calcium-binding protein 3 isoform X4 [Lemur catta]